ncbi:MAG: DUF1573 domain-containing protein, partial [Planctomycetaceae bacterium]|nr:DUF1573 domain-containing protein [Planctomycetaceae bacterium]
TEKSHKFVLKNEGKVPLKYKLKGTSCSCTVSDMEANKIYEVPVGEQGEVELTWNPKAVEPEFSKTADIYTNDCENKVITLLVKGTVQELLSINPVGGWTMHNVERSKPETRTAELYSAVLDEFKLSSVDTSNENVKASFEPISPEELKAMGAKSGYRVTMTLNPKELKHGDIDERITVHTDVEGANEVPFSVKGNFLGPITGLPYRPEGVNTKDMKWRPELLHTDLGQFPADKGGEGWYKIVVAEMPEGETFKVDQIESSLEFVSADVKPLPAPPKSTRQYFLVTFKVQPGTPPGTYQRKKSAKVVLRTNHPLAEEIKFYVEFIAI